MKKLFLSVMLATAISANCLIPTKNVQAITENISLSTVASVNIEQQKNKEEKFDVVKAKAALMEKYKDKLNKKRILSTAEIDNQFNVMLVEGKTEEEIDTFAKENGLIKLEQPQSNDNIMTLSAPSDAICQNISIYYDQYTGEWVVRGSGSWLNNNFIGDVGLISDGKAVGNYDAVGITFYNTNDTYTSSVKSSSAQFYDNHQRQVTSYAPSQGDGKLGVAFYLQDRIYLNPISEYNYDYSMVGQYFNVTMRYDSNFSKYDGTARMFYIHTFNSARINSIGFTGDNSKAFGVNASVETVEKSFQIFSNGDTKF